MARAYIATGLTMPRPRQNWLSRNDLFNVLELTGYDIVAFQQKELSPRRLLGLGSLLNRAHRTVTDREPLVLALTYVVARAKAPACSGKCRVTAIVPCRNEEEGNIEACVTRMPDMGDDDGRKFSSSKATPAMAPTRSVCASKDAFPATLSPRAEADQPGKR